MASLMPDTCGLTRFTRDFVNENQLPVTVYPGEAGTYHVLEEWSHLGLGSAMLPNSRIAEPDAPHREVLDSDGVVLEIFYETVADLADRLRRKTRTRYLADVVIARRA